MDKRPLKILEISTSGTVGTTDMGPISTDICALSGGFQNFGHEVTIVDLPTIEPREELKSGVNIVTVRALPRRRFPTFLADRGLWIVERLGWAAIYILCVRIALRFNDYDVVHVHDYRIAFFLSVFGLGYYYTAHTCNWAILLDEGKPLTKSDRLHAFLETRVIRRSRTTVALGDYLQRVIPDARIEVIPNGTEATRWKVLDQDRARLARGIAPDEFVVFFAGRLARVKGVDILIGAVERLASTLPRLRVIIIGALGDDFYHRHEPSSYAKSLIDKAVGLPVHFAGFISNQCNVFQEYLAASSIAVLPSRTEPQGKVVLEALAMSVPVVASRTGGIVQMLTEDVGCLVPPEDSAALAETIRILHDDPDRLRALRSNCRDRVLKCYTWERAVERHLSLFEHTRN